MSHRDWSIARVMVDIAILAVGLATALALASPQGALDLGVAALILALTVGTDRAVFGRRGRAFWIGFTVTGWLVMATALTYPQQTRSFLLRHGPHLLWAREIYDNQLKTRLTSIARRQAAAERAASPAERDALRAAHLEQVNELIRRHARDSPRARLLSSQIAESGIRLALGLLAGLAGGLLALLVMVIARRGRGLARRLGLPDAALRGGFW